jgi:outer membrane murein-binding lipoprotein Lpp
MNNIVSKILIVANLVFSLCFMCFAGAVYSFQAEWKNKADKTASQLITANAAVADLQGQKDQLTKTMTASLTAETDRANQAEAKVNGMDQNLRQAIGNLANAEKERDRHLADLLVATSEAQARVTETNDGRAEIKRLRDQNNEAISIRRGLEDKNLELEGKLAEASTRELKFLTEVTRLNNLLRLNDVDPRDPVIGPVPTVVEDVEGFVKESRKNASRSAEYVEISVGSDDGVLKNIEMTIHRGPNFLATIRITDVYPDKAIGVVVEETRNGTIARGDNVTTKY